MSSLKVLVISQEDVIKAGGKDMKAAIDDVTLSFSLFEKGDCVFPMKTSLRWGDDDSEINRGRINSMPGYLGGEIDMAGIKWLGGSPLNPFKFGIPRASGILVLNNPYTMVPVAVMEGALISAMRTGAVTGVGAKYLANPDSEVIGLIGAGVQGRAQLMALKETIPGIREVRIFDKDKKRTNDFASEMDEELSLNIKPVENARECVEGSDIFVTAVVSDEPIVKKEWVKDGSFYAHIGSYECEFDVINFSDKIIVDSWEAVIHRDVSSIAKMYAAGLLKEEHIYAEMGEIVNGKKPGRERKNERIIFGPIGLGLHDLAVGTRIYKKVKELKLGKEFALYEKSIWV